MRALLAFFLGLALIFAAGCTRPSQANDKADVDKAIQQYIAAKPGLAGSGMSVEVKQVNFQGDKAEADVLFRAKSNPDASMVMRYALKRTGPRRWAVEGGKSAGVAQPHPPMGGSGMPPQGMPGGEAAPAHPQAQPRSTPKH